MDVPPFMTPMPQTLRLIEAAEEVSTHTGHYIWTNNYPPRLLSIYTSLLLTISVCFMVFILFLLFYYVTVNIFKYYNLNEKKRDWIPTPSCYTLSSNMTKNHWCNTPCSWGPHPLLETDWSGCEAQWWECWNGVVKVQLQFLSELGR